MTTTFVLCGVISVEHGLEFGPAAPEDEDLIGKDLEIRMLEVGGTRILNYTVKVKP